MHLFKFELEAERLFRNNSSFTDVATETRAEFCCKASELPDIANMDRFLRSFRTCDTVDVSIRSYLCFDYHSASCEAWEVRYEGFLANSEPEDDVTVNIHVNKMADCLGVLSVYSFRRFISHYMKMPINKLLHELSMGLKKYKRLIFQVLDQEVKLEAGSVCFLNDTVSLPGSKEDRRIMLIHHNNDALFFNRDEYALVPYDFRVMEYSPGGISSVADFLKKLETAMSYVYLAHAAQMTDSGLVLDLSPTYSRIIVPYEEIVPCQQVCDLFKWAYDGDYTTERAGIIRNLLEMRCKRVQDLILNDDTILLAAKSNYVLYQKKTIDKYIALKNSISQVIVDATNGMETMLQTLIDAIKNNFIAVIMFLITVILTDSVSWEDLESGSIMNEDFLIVLRIFSWASLVYLAVALFGVSFKWHLLYHSYDELKTNYRDLLDVEDLNAAFDGDKAICYIKKKIVIASILTSILWILFLAVFWILVY